MLKYVLFIFLFVGKTCIIEAQESFYIWNEMPNSKGLNVKDSVANGRLYQVAKPSISVFKPAKAVSQNAAVLIIPSGGFSLLTYETGGVHLAKWFNTFGVTAFVLKHRLPKSPDIIDQHKAPLQDAQRAMKYIRANASKWDIDIDKIGVMGCSAGGYVAASLSTSIYDWALIGDENDSVSFKPNFTILISPVITMGTYTHKGSRRNLFGNDISQKFINQFSCENNVTSSTPPAFIIHATDDKEVVVMNSILYYSALVDKNVKNSSLIVFPTGGHSISLRNKSELTDSWPYLAEKWLLETGLLK